MSMVRAVVELVMVGGSVKLVIAAGNAMQLAIEAVVVTSYLLFFDG